MSIPFPIPDSASHSRLRKRNRSFDESRAFMQASTQKSRGDTIAVSSHNEIPKYSRQRWMSSPKNNKNNDNDVTIDFDAISSRHTASTGTNTNLLLTQKIKLHNL